MGLQKPKKHIHDRRRRRFRRHHYRRNNSFVKISFAVLSL